jgi:hypothetical protein
VLSFTYLPNLDQAKIIIMDISVITKLISVILAVSLASERLVTLIKTNISWLQEPAPTVPPVNNRAEKIRRSVLMVISFLIAWVTATYSNGNHDFFDTFKIGHDDTGIYVVIVGLMASGGSAFWTNLLGYVSAVKDVNTQKSQRETLKKEAQLNALNLK